MKKEFIFSIVFFIIFAGLMLSFFWLYSNPKTHEPLPNNYVTKVIDGDTFVINSGETIRLLCIDTPEISQDGYEEAKSFLESLILNKEVTLNSSITDKDVYNRSLRYVYIDNIFVNQEILDQNLGTLLIIPPETCSELQ